MLVVLSLALHVCLEKLSNCAIVICIACCSFTRVFVAACLSRSAYVTGRSEDRSFEDLGMSYVSVEREAARRGLCEESALVAVGESYTGCRSAAGGCLCC